VFPAHAGMNRTEITPASQHICFSSSVPRARGDEPERACAAGMTCRCNVFPAHAGMNPIGVVGHVTERRDVFPAHAGMNRRGLDQAVRALPAVFPAHAGMNPIEAGTRPIIPSAGMNRRRGRVPRARGDEPMTRGIYWPCSPRRG
jgi:hypothetical protein